MTDGKKDDSESASHLVEGPILSLDIGARRVGVAVSDPTLTVVSRLPVLQRTNWKQLLRDVEDLIRGFDAKMLVIGFPLSLEGNELSAAITTRETARKFALSLDIPVYLQDERLSSVEANEKLKAEGLAEDAVRSQLDGEAAAIILRDFIGGGQKRILIDIR